MYPFVVQYVVNSTYEVYYNTTQEYYIDTVY